MKVSLPFILYYCYYIALIRCHLTIFIAELQQET
jgi:hypothetical protein